MTFTTHTITSKDGTVIGFRKTGQGKGLVICHGGGRISQHYETLAAALAADFTVYIPDRRGRGLSGAEGTHYDLTKAVEDLAAVIEATSACFIFGHSAGAMIALETMRTHPVSKLALYEPPVSVSHSFPFDWIPGFEEALRKGKRKQAVAISLKGLNIVEGMGKMPLWLILLLLNLLSVTERKQAPGTRITDLIPTLAADIRMAETLDSKTDRYRQIYIPVSLMAGSKSPRYFHTGLQALATVLPQSGMQLFEGLDHYSPEAKVSGIAEHLKYFFGAHTL